MAATLANQATVAYNPDFQKRCLMARINIAVKILISPLDAYTEQHRNYARQVFIHPMDYPERVTAVVVAQPKIADAEANGTGATDDMIEAQVENAWLFMS